MESVSIKLEKQFMKDMEKIMKKHRYSTKTEFIREAVRDKMTDLEKKEMLARVQKMYGASKNKKKTTDEELHKSRQEVFEELEKEFGLK